MKNFTTAILILLITISYLPAQSKSNSFKTKKLPIRQTVDINLVQALPEDAALINVAAAVVRATPKIVRLWKNYWSPEQAFMIYKPGESALLISRLKPPASFQSLNPASLPQELRGKAYIHRGALSESTAAYNTHYPVGERYVFAVSLGKTYDTLALLFHEGFHEFQIGKKQFARTSGAESEIGVEVRPDSQVISNSEFVALMEVERRILSYATSNVSYKGLILLLRQYLAVHLKRSQALPLSVQQSELNIQRKEGTAALVGYEGAALSLGQELNVLPKQMEISLAEYKELPRNAPYELFRSHAYTSGSAIAWLLTRMGVNWRQRSQQGASFETLLSEAVKFNPKEANSLAETALETFDFAGALKKSEIWKSKLIPEITIADFNKMGKVRLVLEFSFTGKKFPEIQNRGTGLGVSPEDKVNIELGSQLFTIKHPQILLTSENHPQMGDFRKAPKLIRYTIILDEFPNIEDYKPGKSQINWGKGGSIKGQGLILNVDKPATVGVTSDAVIVNLGEL